MTREEEIARAQQAQLLLSHPLLIEAFATVERHLVDGWRATGEAQERERERLWLMLKLLGRIQAQLNAVIETGKLAAHEAPAQP